MAQTPQPPPPGRRSSLAQQAGALSWAQVQVAIVALGEQPATPDKLETVAALLARFVRENEDPRSSPHLRGTAPDRLDALTALLGRAELPPPARLLAVQALKVLARRQDVRLRCTQHVLDTLVPLLAVGRASDGAAAAGGGPQAPAPAPAAAELASECANALSNLCYEPTNASGLLRAGGVPRLLRLLSSADAGAGAHMNAAGALQTLSFQPDGRAALLKAAGVDVLLRRLASTGGSAGGAGAEGPEAKLQQRLVGSLHNLSASSAEGVAAIREQGGVAALAALLDCCHRGVAASAAGALQNTSLEARARADIRAHALPQLAALLVGPDTQAAVCAAGALLNLAEDGLEAAGGSSEQGGSGGSGGSGAREALVHAVAGALAGAAVLHSLGSAAGAGGG